MVSSIPSILGSGSGLDIKAIIDGLANAARAPKESQIIRREATNSAKVSALSMVSNAIDSFASALSSLVSGGSLSTQPSVSDTSIATAVALPGAQLDGFSAELRVEQLAEAQTLASATLASASAPVGHGDLTLTTPSGTYTVTVDASNDNINGLAKAINSKNAGVTATVVSTHSGALLMLKGKTGAANAFTLSVPPSTTSGLERFVYDPNVPGGMTAKETAKDAIIHLDDIEVRNASNTIKDVISGVQLDLKKAAPTTTVSLVASRPTAALGQAVQDFVDAYNELHDVLLDATARPNGGGGFETGPLNGEVGIRDMRRRLSTLTSTVLSTAGGPSTLADIGVVTKKDGKLSIDKPKLSSVLADNPAGVEALFNPRQHSSSPLVSIVSKMGQAKPGTYQLTDLVAYDGVTPASGKIDGAVVTGTGSQLTAPLGTRAGGLVVDVLGAATSVTITVDLGLGGALQQIRDALRASNGPLASAQQRLTSEAKLIAQDRAKMEARATSYYDQLTKTFTAMERQVSASKALQSYVEQQVKMWTASRD